MQAIVQTEYGSADVLRVAEIERPEIGADEVLVRVHAAGLDRGTWHLMTGQPYLMRLMGFGLRAPKNRVPGLDVAGTVVAVGADVTRFAVGDEVFGISRGLLRRVRVRPRGQARAQAGEPHLRAGRGRARSPGSPRCRALRDVGQRRSRAAAC